MTCKNPLSSGPAELMIKQGRLPGGVGLKQEEGWKFFQIFRSQILILYELDEGGGGSVVVGVETQTPAGMEQVT